MKLLLKIHNKERHSTTTAAVNLFQRKRKYYHRRHSKSSSPVPVSSLPASQQSVSPASSTPSHVSSSSGSFPLTSAVTGGVSPGTFDADPTTSGVSLATLIYGGTGSCTEPNACSSDRRPLLRNSPSQSSARSFASSSRSVYKNFHRMIMIIRQCAKI